MQITRAKQHQGRFERRKFENHNSRGVSLKNRFNGEYCIINRLKTVQTDDLGSQGPNVTETGTCEKCMKTLEGIEENIDRKKFAK